MGTANGRAASRSTPSARRPGAGPSRRGRRPADLGIRCLVNGETLQDSNTERDGFRCRRADRLHQRGDHARAGRPDRHRHSGRRRLRPQAAVFLADGDEVTVEIEGLGSLTNPVVAAAGERLTSAYLSFYRAPWQDGVSADLRASSPGPPQGSDEPWPRGSSPEAPRSRSGHAAATSWRRSRRSLARPPSRSHATSPIGRGRRCGPRFEARIGVNGLVNAAGIADPRPLAGLDAQAWRRTIGVNLSGSFFPAGRSARACASRSARARSSTSAPSSRRWACPTTPPTAHRSSPSSG